MAKIQKGGEPLSAGSIHKQKSLPDNLLRFSFRHFQQTDKFCFPDDRSNRYFTALFERLRDYSGMRLDELKLGGKSTRCHPIDWDKTTEPKGYSHLSPQLQDCEPYQLAISANEHGRVHGIMIDSVFYVVWVDPNHMLYE